MSYRNVPSSYLRRAASGNLKRCPLCGAVNARQNGDCFVCGWHGAFDHDPRSVEEGIDALLERCPDLNGVRELPKWKGPTLRDRVAFWWSRVAGRRFDARF